jgi:hypothetical protein
MGQEAHGAVTTWASVPHDLNLPNGIALLSLRSAVTRENGDRER